MKNLARRLNTLHDANSSVTQPSAIFGSIGSLPNNIRRQTRYRVAIWPILPLDDELVEVALGVGIMLGYLLQLHRDIRVYFLPAQLDEAEDLFNWTPEKSRFTPESWSIDDLDENIAIWGEYSTTDSGLELLIHLENDLTSEHHNFSSKAQNLPDLIQLLPNLALSILEKLDADIADQLSRMLTYSNVPNDVQKVSNGCIELFRWELKKYLFLYGQEWEDEDLISDFERLMSVFTQSEENFASWSVAQAMRQLMNPGLSVLGDLLAPQINQVLAQFNNQAVAVITLADGLYRQGQTNQSFELIESRLEQDDNPHIWVKLAQLYAESGRVEEAVGVIQDALQGDIESNLVYRIYGNLLSIAAQYELEIHEVLLINEDSGETDDLIFESIAAYENILKESPDDLNIIHRTILQYLALEALPDSNKVWSLFAQLVVRDETGNRVRDVLDALEFVEDVEPVIDLLQSALKRFPERIDLHLNVAVAYRLDEQYDSAEDTLLKVQALELTEFEERDLESLLLTVRMPEYEHTFSELVAMLAAGKAAKSDDVEFLEDVLEIAPSNADAYVWLARSYMSWDDADAALEVLLDGDKALPNRPQICELIAQLLWDSGERKLAFEYLNRGLSTDPNYIPLLTRIALYLVENGQNADAKLYLARAEMINPRDATFLSARNAIAQIYAEDTSKEKNK